MELSGQGFGPDGLGHGHGLRLQGAMQVDGGSRAGDAERGASIAREEQQQQQQQPLRCPRCDSPNTKFCYYNNYSQSQPRHFCKSCRRYWTRGGALRNVPVGGGCRKNKRPGKLHHPPTLSTPNNCITTSSPHTLPLTPPSPPPFYAPPNLSAPMPIHLLHLPHATVSPPPNHLPALALATGLLGFPGFSGAPRYQQPSPPVQPAAFLRSAPLQLAPPSVPPPSACFTGFIGFNDMDPIVKLGHGLQENQMIDGHAVVGFRGVEEQPLEDLRPMRMPKVEESPSITDWHGYAQTSESSFWNSAAVAWPSLYAHTTSASPLF